MVLNPKNFKFLSYALKIKVSQDTYRIDYRYHLTSHFRGENLAYDQIYSTLSCTINAINEIPHVF